ncbi:MAG: hypothetical protein UT97_C0020G0017 [Parcubacteria group bacterium GW2011_GWC2_40_31]|nr:MAG: hypothetical protein UT97_C0020G0017 [Parcubacteria group bacterium GW2011_GWC2_40_31]
MEVDKEKRDEALKHGTFFGFVPHRLEIKEAPEFNDFPFNVLFSSFGMKDGARVRGSAVYNPDFSTFKKDGDKYSMQYRNGYEGDSWLRIDYDLEKKSWVGEKFVNGESAGMAFGSEWHMFFVHFTMLGLKNGERCMFEPAP